MLEHDMFRDGVAGSVQYSILRSAMCVSMFCYVLFCRGTLVHRYTTAVSVFKNGPTVFHVVTVFHVMLYYVLFCCRRAGVTS